MATQYQDRFSNVRAVGVSTVAAALGMTGDPRKGIGPCPSCGAATRHPKRKDKRGAIGVRTDGQGWICFECGASGDAVTLAAWVVTGTRDPAGRWAEVLARLDSAGLLAPDARPISRPSLSGVRGPPPSAEVGALLASCIDGADDPEVRRWFDGRPQRIDHTAARDRDLFRVLPRTANVAEWAWGPGGAWPGAGYRLIVPVFDAMGAMASVRARRVRDGDGPKAVSPKGFSLSGCVMANSLARLALQRPVAAADLLLPRGRAPIIVAEGEPNFLRLATMYGDDESAPAVFGIVAGSWTDAIAARVPDGARIVIDADDDKNGNHYAAAIFSSLRQRCDIRRVRIGGAS